MNVKPLIFSSCHSSTVGSVSRIGYSVEQYVSNGSLIEMGFHRFVSHFRKLRLDRFLPIESSFRVTYTVVWSLTPPNKWRAATVTSLHKYIIHNDSLYTLGLTWSNHTPGTWSTLECKYRMYVRYSLINNIRKSFKPLLYKITFMIEVNYWVDITFQHCYALTKCIH